MGNPSQIYGASLAIWDHTVLPATRHKWTRPAITPARQAGTRFTYPGGMEGWVELGSLIAARPGIEAMIAWSHVLRPNRYTTKSLTVLRRTACYVVILRDNVKFVDETTLWHYKVSFEAYLRFRCWFVPFCSSPQLPESVTLQPASEKNQRLLSSDDVIKISPYDEKHKS